MKKVINQMIVISKINLILYTSKSAIAGILKIFTILMLIIFRLFLATKLYISNLHSMTFVLKPQAPFERLKLANNSPEVALRKSIILQAIIDASNTSHNKSAKKMAGQAKKWLFNNSEGFLETCLDAELEPDFVIRVALQLINQHQHNNKTTSQKFTQNSLNQEAYDDVLYAYCA